MNLLIDQSPDQASVLAAEAQEALGKGYTRIAHEKFAAAGKLIEREIANTRSAKEIHFLRFLAASQFFHGGHYPRAYEIARRIEARLLPQNVGALFPSFFTDVKSRSDSKYMPRMRNQVAALWAEQKYQQAIDLLKDHPYLYSERDLAFLRSTLCEFTGQWKAAAAFAVITLSGTDDASDLQVMLVSSVYTLCGIGRFEDAWQYIERVRESVPNTVTNFAASFVCFNRAVAANPTSKQKLYQDQLFFFEEGQKTFLELPLARQQGKDLKDLAVMTYDTACMTLMRIREDGRALAIAEEAIRLMPEQPGPWTTRGMLTYPSDAAVNDFRTAIRLKEPGYAPFYYLSHHEFHQERIAECLAYCLEALDRRPGKVIKAKLLGTIAVCRNMLGHPNAEVERIFAEALEVDPDSEQVKSLRAAFRELISSSKTTEKPRWDWINKTHPEKIETLEQTRKPYTRRIDTVRQVMVAAV